MCRHRADGMRRDGVPVTPGAKGPAPLHRLGIS